MLSIAAVSVAAPRTRTPHRGIARIALVAVGTAALLTTNSRAAEAQTTPAHEAGWEFIVPGGLVVPTGAQRGAIKRANLTAAQLSYVVRPALAITTTFGWARSRDIVSANEPKLDVFTYDLGAEVRAPRWKEGHALAFSPFAGVGAGARTYNYRSLHVDATHNLAAYGSVGGVLSRGRVSLRLEARDYVTGFKPLDGRGAADTRNDIVLLAGLNFDWR
jgi:hypothetical protein